MHLNHLHVENFRAISKIDVDFSDGINVIVGPNAIGKTTVLEAIRLAKALLAPRTASEGQQTLLSLGAMSPYNATALIPDGLVRNPDLPLVIKCLYELTPSELAFIDASLPQVITDLVLSRVPGLHPPNASAFLSSDIGKQSLGAAETEVKAGVKAINDANGTCRLNLLLDFKANRQTTDDPIGAAVIKFLDQTLPPHQTKFSYFPADRALPRGEVPMQLGAQDAAQQLEAHNSQPQTKYNRLKNTIFSAILENEGGRASITADFKKIFDGILKGRELIGAGVGAQGLFSIRVRDQATGRDFDIDGMSSGEKGLILTFLLISRTVAEDGIILLDEPELHLNPAVCKDLLPFLFDNYIKPARRQAIICSHSPEILAGVFERDECALLHLESDSKLSKVRLSDEEAISSALRRLGTSEVESLLFKGLIFVEGSSDVEILEAGFGSILRQYKLKDLGGRKEVEKQIHLLQEYEKKDGTDAKAKRYFIFDRDDAPSDIKSTEAVRVLQWSLPCLENYLLDFDSLTDLLTDKDVAQTPLKSQGEVIELARSLAMKHLDDAVIRDVYKSYQFENPGLRPSEIQGLGFEGAAEVLFKRLETTKNQLGPLTREAWLIDFKSKCHARKNAEEQVWGTRWTEMCDGKRLFGEIQRAMTLRLPLLSFKKRLIRRMRETPPRPNWVLMEAQLQSLLS